MSNCILNTNICICTEEVKLINNILQKYNQTLQNSAADAVDAIMKLFNIDREYKIWLHPQVREICGKSICEEILVKLYKPFGPFDSTEWLSNSHIDNILDSWSNNSKELFNKIFLHLPYQCVDFDRNNTTVFNVNINTILKYDMMACVFNTDVSTGKGLHWICVVIDNKFRTIEFFNSSSSLAPLSIHKWIVRLWYDFKNKNINYSMINVITDKPLQLSKTECGIWCLCYIRSRLLSYSPEWIKTTTDEKMINKIRKELFLITK